MTTPLADVTKAIAANQYSFGDVPKDLASAAIEALRAKAEDRAREETLNEYGYPIVDDGTLHVIVQAILGYPE